MRSVGSGMRGMDVTRVRVFPVGEDRLKAYAAIELDGCLVVTNLRVIRGKERLFVAMPSRRTRGGGHRDVVFPVDGGLRERIERAVLTAYGDAEKIGLAVQSGARAPAS
jgi:stage V sporulation protein G